MRTRCPKLWESLRCHKCIARYVNVRNHVGVPPVKQMLCIPWENRVGCWPFSLRVPAHFLGVIQQKRSVDLPLNFSYTFLGWSCFNEGVNLKLSSYHLVHFQLLHVKRDDPLSNSSNTGKEEKWIKYFGPLLRTINFRWASTSWSYKSHWVIWWWK